MKPKWPHNWALGLKTMYVENDHRQNHSKTFWPKLGVPFWGRCCSKIDAENRATNTMSPTLCFGWFLADVGVIVWFMLANVGPLTSKKLRTGKHVKISTVLEREAHFRGFVGVENWQTTSRNRKFDTSFSRDDFGSHQIIYGGSRVEMTHAMRSVSKNQYVYVYVSIRQLSP